MRQSQVKFKAIFPILGKWFKNKGRDILSLPFLLRKKMPNQYLPPVIQIPSALNITAIEQSLPMVITVSVGNSSTQVNDYIVGMSIKLNVPQSYGMFQANNLVGTIIAINGSNFTLNWDSSQFDPFVVPSGNVEQPATIAPNGSRNLQYTNGTSLNVPFQSFNNIGN